MKKAVIFDMDGTILDTIEGLKESTNYALSKYGYETKNISEIRSYVGNGVRKLIERALPRGENTAQFEEILKCFKTHYAKTMANTTRPYNGIIDLLKDFKAKGIIIAVLSNKFDAAVKELCAKYFDGLIDFAQGENETTPPKPNPKGTLEIIKHFNLEKKDVIFVGDSEVDVQTAKNAGIDCIGVCWGFREKALLERENCNYIVSTPDEISAIIKN